ncbi:MAG: flagellar basal-body rod protein FlgF [Alphaproteobacteria bacterium]|nr:flagellar basal-body rod protein FlgF [Rhodospirillales bacterium]MCW9046364.1 flagellar basal-body rod protein FlgF [Alphaproteobacteria bacterium]
MENTLFIALSRQTTLRREMSTIANNLANMNTTGFKGEKTMFVEHLIKSKDGDKILGTKLSYARDIAQYRNTMDGPVQNTGNPLDVAIHGDGYFTVETEQGTRYTRNGNFTINSEGQLTTKGGNPILSATGAPFFFGPTDTNIHIAGDGTVSTSNGELGKLEVVTFENNQKLMKVANGLYTSKDDPQPAETTAIVQGALEGSNVVPMLEMTRMIEVQRSYQSAANLVSKEDQRLKSLLSVISRGV